MRQPSVIGEDVRSQGRVLSALIMLACMVHTGDSVVEMAMTSLALTVVSVSALATLTAKAYRLMGQPNSGVERWTLRPEAWRLVIPAVAAAVVAASTAGGTSWMLVLMLQVVGITASLLTVAGVLEEACRANENRWRGYWIDIYANSRLRAKFSAAYVYLETQTDEGWVRKRYLLDLGAAASVIPLPSFAATCFKMNLQPSEAKLRGASGHSIPVEVIGELKFRMPDCESTTTHKMEVVSEGTMPAGLRILGIDFWYNLDSRIDMVTQTVEGTTPQGEKFTLPFYVSKQRTDVNATERSFQREEQQAVVTRQKQVEGRALKRGDGALRGTAAAPRRGPGGRDRVIRGAGRGT